MLPNKTKHPVSPQQDDAYWNSLFALEEVNNLEEPPSTNFHEPPADIPPLAGVTLNGQVKTITSQLWQQAQKAFDNDEVLELSVVGYNKGGLLVEWNGLQGFVPASQLLNLPHFHIETERIRELKRRQDQTLQLKIIELDRGTNRLILSERTAAICATDRDELLSSINSGDHLTGTVTNLTNFGAFVDLGGIEGLIHISELSWGRVEHPSHILSAGDEVQVLVLSVDSQKERIALSRKKLRNNPWHEIEQRYAVGQTVQGTVSNIVHFGAFVLVEDGLEGLVHISELAEGTFLHPRNVVSLGQTVSARVIEVNGGKRRLALSMRDVQE